MSREGPIPLSADLERFLEAIGAPQVSLLVRLNRAWPEIAGALLAGKAHPFRFRNGTLTIGVRNHAWAQELQMAKPALLSNIRRALGPDSPVTELRFVVEPAESGGLADRPVAEESAAPPPPAPDPEGLAQVPDEQTRESLRAIHRRARRVGDPKAGKKP
jgi:hypothetical protein